MCWPAALDAPSNFQACERSSKQLKDQSNMPTLCSANWAGPLFKLLMADAERASNNGSWRHSSLANAQAMLAWACGRTEPKRRRACGAMATSRGASLTRIVAKDHAVFTRCCASNSGISLIDPHAMASDRGA